MVKLSPGHVAATRRQRKVGRLAKGVYEARSDLCRVKERSIGKHLMKIRAMGIAQVFTHPMPSALIQLSEMRLVLGIEDMDFISAAQNKIGCQMTERA